MLKIENTSEYNKITDWQVSKNLIIQRGIYNDSLTHRTQKLKLLQKKLWYSELMSEVKRTMPELLITEESSIRRSHLSLATQRLDL